MHLLHSLLDKINRIAPAKIAYAHCDIPCGIYDPHAAQMAAHTVIRMVKLVEDLTASMKANQNPTMEERRDFVHKLSRYTAVKEHHAELCKQEIRILWGDYFKPEHAEVHPELHSLVWQVMKFGSHARQETGMKHAEELLEAVNKIAEIFWSTKGKTTMRAKAPYPTEKETVYPVVK